MRATGAGMSNEIALASADATGEVESLISNPHTGMRSSPKFSPGGRWLAWLESADTRSQDVWKIRIGADGRPEGTRCGSPTRWVGSIRPT